MSLGSFLRSALGRFERPVSEWSRAAFFDVDAFVAELRSWSDPATILEIGCGHGHVTEALARGFPVATITGIDVAPCPGRLFAGDRRRVEFRRQRADELAREQAASFDLVVLSDVLHHVAGGERAALLAAAFDALAPRGRLALKDWERSMTPVHLLAFLSDRFVTGDRVRFVTVAELERLVCEVASAAVVERRVRLPPWRNNFALLVRRDGGVGSLDAGGAPVHG
jgi:2-polyprenyl-6-hydroxyphenyl methylase/3-demethylubiquinone-9 3-methyltransferase